MKSWLGVRKMKVGEGRKGWSVGRVGNVERIGNVGGYLYLTRTGNG